MQQDSIRLTVPTRGEYARTVRMTAAQLASRLGMSYDEVDDVRIAAEEAFVYACGCASEADEVTFTFTIGGEGLDVAVGPLPGCCSAVAVPHSDGYAEFILRAVCDELTIAHETGRCMLHFRFTAAVGVGEPGA